LACFNLTIIVIGIVIILNTHPLQSLLLTPQRRLMDPSTNKLTQHSPPHSIHLPTHTLRGTWGGYVHRNEDRNPRNLYTHSPPT
jgi:hypothetical protein